MEISYQFLGIKDVQMQLSCIIVSHYKLITGFILVNFLSIDKSSCNVKSGIQFHVISRIYLNSKESIVIIFQ